MPHTIVATLPHLGLVTQGLGGGCCAVVVEVGVWDTDTAPTLGLTEELSLHQARDTSKCQGPRWVPEEMFWKHIFS